jgi:predicted S18 family serine protease
MTYARSAKPFQALDILIMMPVRRCVLPLALAAALAALAPFAFVACGGDPPDKEIQQAHGAIDAAKAVGAEQYASEEFAAAQTALKNATDAVDQRDYRLALNHALDARDRAKTAARQAADRKAAARVDADRALAASARAQAEAQGHLKPAETNRLPARTVQDARRTLTTAEGLVQKARTSFEQGDYPAATQAANQATSQFQSIARILDPTQTGGPRRRR